MRNARSAIGGKLAALSATAGLCLAVLAGPANAQDAEEEATGADLWRQGGCFNCHGNLADGEGDPAYPVGPSLRTTGLDRDMLIETISCGRPSTFMPMFLEGAYTETECYGMAVGEVPDGINMGGSFTAEEIERLVDFLVEHVVGETTITRENCGAFYNGNVDAPLCRQF